MPNWLRTILLAGVKRQGQFVVAGREDFDIAEVEGEGRAGVGSERQGLSFKGHAAGPALSGRAVGIQVLEFAGK